MVTLINPYLIPEGDVMRNGLFIFMAAVVLLLSGCGDKSSKVKPTVTPGSTDGTRQDTLNRDVIIEENLNRVGSVSEINGQLQSVYFDFDKFRIRSDMQDRVDKDARLLKTTPNRVKVAGNCDEWGSDEYNYALGLKRAKSMKSALISSGVDAQRVSIISFGENKPVCTSATKACWSKNRRADVRVLP
jgi:peptidoglycan-associated lipoprotein